jgi:hypothetical protein
MIPNASSAISNAAGSTLTRRTSGPLLGFLCEFVDVGVVGVPLRAVLPAATSAAEPAGAGRRESAALVVARPEAGRPAAPPRLREPRLPPAVDRPPGAVRFGADWGADWGAPWAAWEPEAGVEAELASGERGPDEPAGVCTTGFGSGGALTGGVVMLGVLSDGTPIRPTVAGGVVTDGTVPAGTLIVGVGTLTVGTLTVGTLIVGTDASEDAAATSSAPQIIRAASTRRRMGARTGH